MTTPVTAVCLCCHHTQPLKARRLCNACYERARRRGRLADYPLHPGYRHADELLEDYRMLRGEGYNVPQIAERLGMRLDTLRQAIHRARARGDARATG